MQKITHKNNTFVGITACMIDIGDTAVAAMSACITKAYDKIRNAAWIITSQRTDLWVKNN